MAEPSTQAGRIAWRDGLERKHILAIEEQARAEGRQQAVREAAEAIGGFLWLGNNLHNSGTETFREMYGHAMVDARPVYDRLVAGLTSEGSAAQRGCSCPMCVHHTTARQQMPSGIGNNPRDSEVGDASESGQPSDTFTMACGCLVDGNQLLISCSAEHAPDYQPSDPWT